VVKISLILILAVLAASVQCAAACTPAVNAMPHCHHHKQAPKQACSNELVAANPAQLWFTAPGTATEPCHFEYASRMIARAATPQAFDSPPPGRSISVLRI